MFMHTCAFWSACSEAKHDFKQRLPNKARLRCEFVFHTGNWFLNSKNVWAEPGVMRAGVWCSALGNTMGWQWGQGWHFWHRASHMLRCAPLQKLRYCSETAPLIESYVTKQPLVCEPCMWFCSCGHPSSAGECWAGSWELRHFCCLLVYCFIPHCITQRDAVNPVIITKGFKTDFFIQQSSWIKPCLAWRAVLLVVLLRKMQEAERWTGTSPWRRSMGTSGCQECAGEAQKHGARFL